MNCAAGAPQIRYHDVLEESETHGVAIAGQPYKNQPRITPMAADVQIHPTRIDPRVSASSAVLLMSFLR
jgi:hypothetical protein